MRVRADLGARADVRNGAGPTTRAATHAALGATGDVSIDAETLSANVVERTSTASSSV